MVGFALGFLSKYWKWLVLLAIIAVCFFLVRSYNYAIADAVRQKDRADNAIKSALAWERSYRFSEYLREQETRQAVSSASRERQQCNQRVADSLKSANAIRRTVSVQSPSNTSTSVITTNQLRDSLGGR